MAIEAMMPSRRSEPRTPDRKAGFFTRAKLKTLLTFFQLQSERTKIVIAHSDKPRNGDLNGRMADPRQSNIVRPPLRFLPL